MVQQTFQDYGRWNTQVKALEDAGKVTRTFRRLEPDRQWAIVEALLTEAAAGGPSGLNVKQVAARAGVSVGSLYQYFPRRDEMLDVAARLAAQALVESLGGAAPELARLPLPEALTAYLVGGLEWSREFAGPLTVFAHAAYGGDARFADDLVRPVAAAMLGVVRTILAAAHDRGELRPGLDLDVAARLVNTLLVAAGDAALLPHLDRYYALYGDGEPPGGAWPPEHVTAVLHQAIAFAVRAVAAPDAGAEVPDDDVR